MKKIMLLFMSFWILSETFSENLDVLAIACDLCLSPPLCPRLRARRMYGHKQARAHIFDEASKVVWVGVTAGVTLEELPADVLYGLD